MNGKPPVDAELEFRRDLARWEAGELSTVELAARWPEAEGLLAVHRLLSAASAEPVPDAGEGWERVRARLGERPRHSPARVRRALLAVAAALALAGTAYAAGPGALRRGIEVLIDWPATARPSGGGSGPVDGAGAGPGEEPTAPSGLGEPREGGGPTGDREEAEPDEAGVADTEAGGRLGEPKDGDDEAEGADAPEDGGEAGDEAEIDGAETDDELDGAETGGEQGEAETDGEQGEAETDGELAETDAGQEPAIAEGADPEPGSGEAEGDR